MRTAFLFLLLNCTTGHAAGCPAGSAEILQVVDWSAKMGENSIGPAPELTISYSNRSTKTIRMMDGRVWFFDALGGTITPIGLDRDARLGSGATKTETGQYPGSSAVERLTRLEKRDVETAACVTAVIYEDGTKETFE